MRVALTPAPPRRRDVPVRSPGSLRPGRRSPGEGGGPPVLLPLWASLCLLLAMPSALGAAVTAVQRTTASSTADAGSYTTVSITPTANTLLLAWITNTRASNPTLPSLSGNGLTWVQVATQTWSTSGSPTARLTLFRAMGAAPSSGAVTIGFGGTVQTGGAWTIIEFGGVVASGADGADAVVQSVTGVANGAGMGGLTLSLSPLEASTNATAGGFANRVNNANSLAAGTGYAAFPGTTFATPSTSARAEWRAMGSATVDMDQSASSDIAGIGVEIRARYAVGGKVFEDLNYGGGAGRNWATASSNGAVGRPGARVELYDNTGDFVTSTVTDAGGDYIFTGLAGSTLYQVRVVSGGVTSSRTGYAGTCRPVLTFRADASSGAPVDATSYVGGLDPATNDAGNAGGGWILNAATGAFSGSGSGKAHAFSAAAIGAADIMGLDFGFSFDAIVNKNDVGQGSLRQLLINANTLGGDAGLAQSGLVAGRENAVWMISNGTSAPGLRSAINYFAGGFATLRPDSTLPAISSPLVLDAQRQPGWIGAPIIELDGSNAGGYRRAGGPGLSLSAGNSTIRGLIINRFDQSGIEITTNGGNRIAGCYIGTNAAGTAAAANGSHGIDLADVPNNTIGGTTAAERNVISGNSGHSLYIEQAGSTGNLIQGNYVGRNASNTATIAGSMSLIRLGGGASDNSIGGAIAGAGNVISGSAHAGIRVDDSPPSLRDGILGNSIFGNGWPGIDLRGDQAVNPNNGTKNGTLPNFDMDFPVFTSATLAGSNLTVAGYVGSAPNQATFANARVEVFKSDNDASGYGEGQTYLGFLTSDANGNFSGTIAAGTVGMGDRVTGTATDASNNTSEFGPNLTVTGGISGTLFEDKAGDGLPAGQAIGDAANPGANGGITVQLYTDNGDGLPGAGDALAQTTTTAAGGAFSFAGAPAGTYWLVVNSKQVAPAAGFNAGFGQSDVWAEQTWGPSGCRCSNGAGGTTTRGSAGSCYGGQRGGQSDNTSALATAEHVARVVLGATGATGENFGFSFDVVGEVRGGDNADDDGGANRTVQGSLRQFLQNARAIVGADAMRFVPAVVTNASGGGGNWWRIGATAALPAIGDAATTIEGAAYALADGTTARDDNPGQLGTGGTVGADALALDRVNRPELEIQDLRGTAVVGVGLDVQAASAVIQHVAVGGFGAVRGADTDANIRVGAAGASALIQQNVLGTGPASFSDPGAATRAVGDLIRVVGAASGTVRNNLIGFSAGDGVAVVNPGATGWLIQDNEIRGNGVGSNVSHGVRIESGGGSTTLRGNLLAANSATGVSTWQSAGSNTLDDNTVSGNGAGSATENAGLALYDAGSTASNNVLTANAGAGVLVVSGAGGQRLTRNSVYGNGPATGQIGIDLLAAGDDQGLGTSPFRTLNDDGDADAGGNGLLNFPILTNAAITGGELVLTGYARPGSVIEIFSATPDPSGFGEGRTYLLTLTEGGAGAGGDDPYPDTDAGSGRYGPGAINGLVQGSDSTNKFVFTVPIPPGVISGTVLCATATLAGATSEFSGNVTVGAVGLSGTVFEDPNHGGGAGRDRGAASGVGRANARVEIYDAVGNLVATTTTNGSGSYSFVGLAVGDYTVRVVNGTVTSSRPGYVAGLWPVQTFRTDAAAGTPDLVTDHVGGEVPSKSDAGNGSTTLAALTTATTTAQSITRATLGPGGLAGVDFGYCFDVIVNRNDSGQGSLRQFLLNANALSNAGLAQSARPAGIENAILMLADGTDRPGLIAGYASQFVGGVATVAPLSALPGITEPIVLDAQTQPGWTSAPIVELNGVGAGAGADGLSVTAGGSSVRGLAINRFGNDGVRLSGASGNTVAGCRIGTNAAGTAAAPNGKHAIEIANSAGNTIGGTGAADRNVLSGNTQDGIAIVGASATNNAVLGNLIGLNAAGTAAIANALGVVMDGGASATTVGGLTAAERNVISGNSDTGVLMQSLGTSGNVVQGNFIGTDLAGTAPIPNGNYGVVAKGGATNSGVGGTQAGAGNLITASGSHGVVIAESGTKGIAVQQNSVYANGGIGITLGWDAVTPNNGTKDPALPNEDMDSPVFTRATVAGATLTVDGYVGSAPGQAVFAGARVEVFESDGDPAGYGEGRTYLGFLTAGADGSFGGSLDVGGLGVGDAITGTATDGAGNTSEFGANKLAQPPSIVKRAFLVDGTPIETGTVLPKGVPLKFLLYLNNPGAAVTDLSLRDVLDPGFEYVGGSIKYDDSESACSTEACGEAEEMAIFGAADGGTPGTDGRDGDVVSWSGTSIYAGDRDVANGRLDIAPGRVFAIVFTVRIR